MKTRKLTILLLMIWASGFSQAIYKTIPSQILETDRKLKILLPRGYSENDDKAYPVIYVFDGDYMFETVAGNVDYYAYWEEIPESIVVGINQVEHRSDDLIYSEQNSLPIESGADFFEFVGKELIPFIEKNYKTEPFRVAIGHGETANFINYYLIRETPIFNAYVVVSPDLVGNMENYITERLATTEEKIFYFLGGSSTDIDQILKSTKGLHQKIEGIKNENLYYTYVELEDVSHYVMPAHVIPQALESIFFPFQPITKKEYEDVILALEGSPVDFLIERYDALKEKFGIEKQIVINDFRAIAAAINKKKKWEYYEDLSKVANTHYPETVLPYYYKGLFQEHTGSPKKAMKTFQSAYNKEEIAGITTDMMLEKAEAIKRDFGY